MSTSSPNPFPKIHNAMWPGLVGKGSPGAEPCLDLDTMLNLTAAAEVNGVKFDGVDIFLYEPHINIDSSDDDLKRVADKIAAKGFVVGSVVAPIWPPTGGGSAMGSEEERKKFVQQVRKGCRIAAQLRKLGIRPYGVVRIDTACSVDNWNQDPEGNSMLIAQTFREACVVAKEFGEQLAVEGEICWGGLHSWKAVLQILELVDRPETLGFQADMAHTLLYLLGYNKPEDALLPPDWNWSKRAKFDAAYKALTSELRPWTIDFHVAQNDATVKGSGSHDKTGRHCLPKDPNGKLDIVRHAGFWLRNDNGVPTKLIQHLCWDGCMFPNDVMMKPETWNDILAVMIAVRQAHGWQPDAAPPVTRPVEVRAKPAVRQPARKSPARKAPAPIFKNAVVKKPVKKAAPKRPAKKVSVKKTVTTQKQISMKKAIKQAVKKPAAKAAKPAKKAAKK